MLLPDAIRHARKELGLSQQKLADVAGIERKQLSILENGGNVTLTTLRKVLAHLPNLRAFALDTIPPTTVSVVPPAARPANGEVIALLTEAVRMLSEGMTEEPAAPADEPDKAPRVIHRRGASGAFVAMAALAARRKRR